jgi:hypothetical protein
MTDIIAKLDAIEAGLLARIGAETEALHRDLMAGGMAIRRIAPADFFAKGPTDDK